MSDLIFEPSFEADVNRKKDGGRKPEIYEIMHMERAAARISRTGQAWILEETFLPYDLYLEEEGSDWDVDVRQNNLDNFYYWCASRVLSLDRKYAKEILNSIGAAQAVTDRDRAEISLSYHCVSLTDVFWVRKMGENTTFAQINLYDHTLNEALVEISLRGRQMTVTNQELAQDLSTRGCFPKAWIRRKDGFYLLKDGDEDAVWRELLASRICQCFAIPQVVYRQSFFQGLPVTKSRLVTSKKYSMVSKMSFDIFAANHDLDTLAICRRMDPVTYYGMNLLDYLTGNTDRHPENWGFLVDNETNQYISLYPVMDFNRSFLAYDTLEGANCQTVFPEKMSQREAAMEAVKRIGLPQTGEVDMGWFGTKTAEAEMFRERLALLRRCLR